MNSNEEQEKWIFYLLIKIEDDKTIIFEY